MPNLQEENKIRELQELLSQTTNKQEIQKIKKRIRYYQNTELYKQRASNLQSACETITFRIKKERNIKQQLELKAKELNTTYTDIILTALDKTYNIK